MLRSSLYKHLTNSFYSPYLIQRSFYSSTSYPSLATPTSTPTQKAARNYDNPIWKTASMKGTGLGSTFTGQSGTHKIVTDEPHGSNTAATPLETLLAALAGCEHATSMYLAKKLLKINIESMDIDLTGEYDARAILGVQGIPAKFQTVRGSITVKTDGTQEQVQQLADLMPQYCPVANLFKSAGVKMDVVWKKA